MLRTLWSNLVSRPPSSRAKGKLGGGIFKRSLSIRQVDCGSCGACDLEIAALGQPHYDAARLGIQIVASPRHADALLVTGLMTPAMMPPLTAVIEATPRPYLIVAVGDCACGIGKFSGIVGFAGGHSDRGRLDEIAKVDIRIPGCPPAPGRIVEGLTSAQRASPAY